MPTRRDRIITSFAVIAGDWVCVTTGFLGSSKNRAFTVRSFCRRGSSGHGFDFAAPGGCEDRLKQRDIVHKMFSGDPIALNAANSTREGYEIVPHRLGGGYLCCRDRAANLCGCDDPAVGCLDMRLVANVDPAFRAKDRETRYEGIRKRGRHVRGAAAPELDIGGDGVALREVRGELFADAPHALGRPKQANRQIEQMDACSRHPARRSLVRLQAPVVAIERQELVMTEVGLDLVNAPQFSGVGFRQQLRDRGLPTALVPHPENEPSVATQPNGLFGGGLVPGQRLLTKNLLPSPDSGLD